MTNAIITSMRTLWKHRLYTFINVFTLAAGLASFLLIALFVRHELSYETQYEGASDIHRLNWVATSTGARFATFFNPVGNLLSEAHPEVEEYTRFASFEILIKRDDVKFFENAAFAESNFFSMFPMEFLSGNPDTALLEPNTIVLTEAAAQKYFGHTDVVGETLFIDGQLDVTITGVIQNLPSNTHLIDNFYSNIQTLRNATGGGGFIDNVFSDQFYQYIRVIPGTDMSALVEKFNGYLNSDIDPRASGFAQVVIQPLADIHLTPGLDNEINQMDTLTGLTRVYRPKSDIWIFIAVAIVTLAVAAFNFMNLQIAQATTRGKEIGIKKVMGARRDQIAAQFMGESVLLGLIALILAGIVLEMMLPKFNQFAGTEFTSSVLLDPVILGGAFLIAIISASLAGVYPAFILARINPARILHGEQVAGAGAARVRSGLVILQFSIAIGLIIASAIVSTQIRFVMSAPMGFDRERIVNLKLNSREAADAWAAMRIELLANPEIIGATISTVIPTGSLSDGSGIILEGHTPDDAVATRRVSIDYEFFNVYGIDLLAGRSFSEEFGLDQFRFPNAENPTAETSIILNETAMRRAGWSSPEEAIGKRAYSAFSQNGVDLRINYTIVGIVRDIHYRSIRTEVAPITYYLTDRADNASLKITGNNLEATLAHIDETWARLVPDFPIQRTFLDETFEAMYAAEVRTLELFIGLAGIAILIACIGLYGLASFTVDKRTKEIGVRKVHGATVGNIVSLLSWDFSKLVIVANVVAWPAAWLLMGDWLQGFVYRTEIGLMVFVISALAALGIALVTIMFRTVRAARQSPVVSLRSE